MVARKKSARKAPASSVVEKKHTVRASIQILELTKAGTSVSFEIRADGKKIGTIVIGRGSFTWYGKKKKTGGELSWSRFAQLMDEQFY
jgi:hypothetical protein